LDWHGSSLVWLGDADPFAAHLGIELHFNGTFAQVVTTDENEHHAHAGERLFDDHKAIEV